MEPETINIQRTMFERHAKAAGLSAGARLGVFATHGLYTKTADRGRGFEIETVATTDDVDSDDEVVLPGGLDLTYLERNRKVFADHMYSIPHTVAKLQDVRYFPDARNPKGLLCRATLINDDTNPYVRAIRAMASDPDMGVGMSIGFEAIEVGSPTAAEREKYAGAQSIVRKARVLEVSYTALPANVSCQGAAISYDTRKCSRFDLLCRKGLIPSIVAREVVARRPHIGHTVPATRRLTFVLGD